MDILRKINRVRRILMDGITKNIGQTQLNEGIDPVSKSEIKRILICRPNHRLGNLLLITPLLHEVTAIFPEAKIDLFVKGFLAPTLFKNYSNIEKIIQLPKKPFSNLIQYARVWMTLKRTHYDLVINVVKLSSSGRLAVKATVAKYKFFGDDLDDNHLKYDDQIHVAKRPIYNLRSYLTRLGITVTQQPIAPLDIKLTPSELGHGKKLLRELVKNDKKTFCVFTYATGEKCYSESWWEKFYNRLILEYPEYNIVEILPAENISKIGFKGPSFYSKDVREIGAVMANTELFIGADSGIMHLASASLTPTIGLFSITDSNTFRPYHNGSLGINTNDSTIEDWIKIIDSFLRKDHLVAV
jgi:ADP-heptose:LPS heptosyltransferase